MVFSLLFFSPVAKKLRIMDDQGVQKQMAETYSSALRVPSTKAASIANSSRRCSPMSRTTPTYLYKQDIDDNLELWVNGLKVKDVRQETIECMPLTYEPVQ